jgi:MFS family permease
MMLGNGLQGSLLGLRATMEGFPTAITGIVMSGYFIGFLAGSTLAPKIVKRVGHIRVFAALASLASAAALLHVVFIDPAAWMAMRLITGFSYAGLYVVAESWLNARSTNENRGQLLSVYMVVMLGGMAGGQLLLNVADPEGFALFILVSVLVSLALVPIALTAAPAPDFDTAAPVGLLQLYRISPLGVVGCMTVAIAHGAFFAMGAVYGEKLGLSLAGISIFMGLFMAGGVVLQWPIGRLSDRYDRRLVLTVATFLAAAAAVAALLTAPLGGLPFYAAIGLLGGMSLPIYSLCLAHTNDYLVPGQVVGASSALVMVTGLGAILGPIVSAAAMSKFGPGGFLWTIALVHAGIGAFALYRMTRRPSVPSKDKVPHLDIGPRATTVATAWASQTVHAQAADDAGGGDD